MYSSFFLGIFLALSISNCQAPADTTATNNVPTHTNPKVAGSELNSSVVKTSAIKTGAEQTARYLPLLKGKKVALVVNQTSIIGKTHLVDSLLSLGVAIKTIYAPEHGFRGDADAGAHINNATDAKTGLPILSLYGKNKKPTKEQLAGVEAVLFDIQDVGARFYTYILSLIHI